MQIPYRPHQRPIAPGELGRQLIFHVNVAWQRKEYVPRVIIYGPTSEQKRTVAGYPVPGHPRAFAMSTETNPFPVAGTYHLYLEMRKNNQIMLRNAHPYVLQVPSLPHA